MTSLLSKSSRFVPLLGLASLLLATAPFASAELITDPVGDFLPSYNGPHNADLDVVSAQVFFTGSNFVFTSTMNGLIGTTPTGLYVWGIDRGAGIQGFPDIAPGVLFDSVLVLDDSTTGTLHDFVTGVATTINGVTIAGSTITATVPLSALPGEGFSPTNYLVNLWPRSGAGGEPVIADFAPNNSDALVTDATPEPATVSLVGGMLLVGVSMIRRKRSNR